MIKDANNLSLRQQLQTELCACQCFVIDSSIHTELMKMLLKKSRDG